MLIIQGFKENDIKSKINKNFIDFYKKVYYNEKKVVDILPYNNLLNDEKRKIIGLINKEFISLDFSSLKLILDNNMLEPLWMDVYILIYKTKLPPAVGIYDILLSKLSKSSTKFYFKNVEGDRYLADADEFMIKKYVRYLVTNEKVSYQTKVQYIPNKDYIKELLKYSKFRKCGIYLNHIQKDEFIIDPLDCKILNIDDAKLNYERIFDAYDLFSNLKLEKNNFINNFDIAVSLGKDKKLIATLSTVLNSFDCKFILKEDYISIEGTKIQVTDEDTSASFQEHLLDTYQFFRNVVNTKDKKDMISEIYSKKIDPDIMEEFNKDIPKFLNIVENKELIDWIITISKESKYTLNIKFDEQGVFYIEDEIIVTPLEAKEYYISYMDKKKDKLSMTIYSNSILGKIRKAWNLFRAKFARR